MAREGPWRLPGSFLCMVLVVTGLAFLRALRKGFLLTAHPGKVPACVTSELLCNTSRGWARLPALPCSEGIWGREMTDIKTALVLGGCVVSGPLPACALTYCLVP